MRLIAVALPLTVAALSSGYASSAFEFTSLKHQKPYVLEIRYGFQVAPQAATASLEPSAEFLANATSLTLRAAQNDSNQIAIGPFTFGFILAPEQQADTFSVTFQGAYQQADTGKSFQGAAQVPLNEWIVIAESSSLAITPAGT